MTQSSEIEFDTKVVRSTIAGLKLGKPIVIQQGGTWSGKTYGVLLSFYLLARAAKDPVLFSVVGVTVPHLKRGALRQFEDIVSELGGVDDYNKTDKIFKIGKAKIEFFSADDDGKVRGSKRDYLFINECNLLNYERYRQLAMRTSKSTVLDFNPVGEFWLHDRILPVGGYVFKRTTYKDNPAVPDKVKKDIEALKDTDPMLYRIYAEGRTGQIQGLVFNNVQFVDEWPTQLRKRAYGLDFGFTNDPTALVEIGEVHGQLFGRQLIYETGLTNVDIANKLRELKVSRRDHIFADAAEPKSIAEIKRFGFNIRSADKGKDSIQLGIDILKRYQINIMTGSVDWRKEAQNYSWAQDMNGKSLNKPIDKHNHCWDAARYYAVMKLGHHKGRGLKM